MVSRQELERVVQSANIWVDEKHTFTLSPDVFRLSAQRKNDLEILGGALFECLSGIGRIAVVAGNPELSRSNAWKTVNKALWQGIPSIFRSTYAHRPNSIPEILKIDMIELQDGSFQIAEIDGYNERGLGYGILFNRMRSIISPTAEILPGAGKCLVDVMKMRKYGQRILLLYANRERFYLPEFRIVREEMMRYGIEVTVASEDEVEIKAGKLFVRGNSLDTTVLFYLPFLYFNLSLNTELAKMYTNGEINFLMPPKPFLGSKAVMAILRNDEGNEDLEAILRSHISGSHLDIVRRFIPRTLLVQRDNWKRCPLPTNGYVLKKTIASGMKGTFFQEDEQYPEKLQDAIKNDCSYVLQEEVSSSLRAYSYFDGGETLSSRMCYNRLIAHYIGRRLAEVTVTALSRKAVHGAPDSIFLGTVLTEESR